MILLEGDSLIMNVVAGDLGGRADWNGAADRDSVCDPCQNQMAERGTVLRAPFSFINFIVFALILILLYIFSLDPKRSVQAMLAEERIRVWGGNMELPETRETRPRENVTTPV